MTPDTPCTARPSWFPGSRVLTGIYRIKDEGLEIFEDEFGREWRFRVGEVVFTKIRTRKETINE